MAFLRFPTTSSHPRFTHLFDQAALGDEHHLGCAVPHDVTPVPWLLLLVHWHELPAQPKRAIRPCCPLGPANEQRGENEEGEANMKPAQTLLFLFLLLLFLLLLLLLSPSVYLFSISFLLHSFLLSPVAGDDRHCHALARAHARHPMLNFLFQLAHSLGSYHAISLSLSLSLSLSPFPR